MFASKFFRIAVACLISITTFASNKAHADSSILLSSLNIFYSQSLGRFYDVQGSYSWPDSTSVHIEAESNVGFPSTAGNTITAMLDGSNPAYFGGGGFIAISAVKPNYSLNGTVTSSSPVHCQLIYVGQGGSHSEDFLIPSGTPVAINGLWEDGSTLVEIFCSNQDPLSHPYSTSAQVTVSNLTLVSTLPGNSTVTVTAINPAQVIYNPTQNINSSGSDVVLGKSMSFEVILAGAANNVASGDYIKVQIVDQDGFVISQSGSIPVSAISSPGFRIPASKMTTYVPSQIGTKTISARVETSLAPHTTGIPLTGNILNTIKTYIPSIGLMQSTDCLAGQSCYGAVDPVNFAKIFSESTFLSDILPVADKAQVLLKTQSYFSGNPIVDPTLAKDILRLKNIKLSLGLNRIVAVVTVNYFAFHNYPEYSGVNYADVSFVGETQTGTLPHEIGHTLGQKDDYYDNVTRLYNGPYITGYNGRTNESFAGAESIMGPDEGTLNNIWIDNLTYSIIFHYLTSQPIDPAMISVSGVLNENGSFNFESSFSIQNGYLIPSDPIGDLTINAVDGVGSILATTKVQSNFNATVSYKLGSSGPANIDLGAMAVVATFPYDTRLKSFQIIRGGKILATTSINSRILQGLIDSIPDSAFHMTILDKILGVKIADKRRILIDEVTIIQKFIDSKKSKEAVVSLKIFIDTIKTLTYSNYAVADASQMNQTTIIEKTNEIINSLK